MTSSKNDKARFSRDIGLEIGSVCGKHFLQLKHLHYGYWTDDLAVDIVNLHTAQENYVKFLMSHIPDGVKKILDVGCGTGQMAKDLQEVGFHVDCISPNSFFAQQARQLLGEASCVFECRYEEFQSSDQYDLVLFSESFQYIDPPTAIEISISLLREGGYLLICDFFQKPSKAKSPLSGGRSLQVFYEAIARYPLTLIRDLDITEATAPTMDVMDKAFTQAVKPTVILTAQLLENRYPWAYKLFTRLYRRRIEKVTRKYFTGRQTGENFNKFKSYRLLLYRKMEILPNNEPIHVE